MTKNFNLIVQIGDITNFCGDCIVNAANHTLLGGSGVDGAIHKAAGPLLLEECKTLGGCETGGAKLTQSYNLPFADAIIHTVGPIWAGGLRKEAILLASCYRNCIRIANECGYKSIAFPAISCGIYRFPIDQACEIAVKTIYEAMRGGGSLTDIYLVAFDSVLEKALLEAISKFEKEQYDEEEEMEALKIKYAPYHKWLENRFQLKPGDFYEDCSYHPNKCTSINLSDTIPEIQGISLITGQQNSHSASLNHCGVIPLTQEQVDRKLEAYKRGGMDELVLESEKIQKEIKTSFGIDE